MFAPPLPPYTRVRVQRSDGGDRTLLYEPRATNNFTTKPKPSIVSSCNRSKLVRRAHHAPAQPLPSVPRARGVMLCATGTDPHCNPMIKTGFQYIIIAPPPLTPSQHVCITPLHELIVIEANAEFAIVQVDGVRGCACPLPPLICPPPLPLTCSYLPLLLQPMLTFHLRFINTQHLVRPALSSHTLCSLSFPHTLYVM